MMEGWKQFFFLKKHGEGSVETREKGLKKRDVIRDPDGERLAVGSSRGLGALS